MQDPVETRFNANSTADDVVAGMDLSGKCVVITGSAGIGNETARALASAGADIILGSRNKDAVMRAVAEISASAKGQVLGGEIDLLSLRSVAQFASWVSSLGRPIDLLILNAAVMACPLARSAEGIESQLAINFIGHALLTSRLVPSLLNSPAPRVISVSSRGHQMSPVVFEDINYQHRAYDTWQAYAQSKTANSLLAVMVSRELGGLGVTAHTLHPGGVRTGLLKHVTGDIAAELSGRYKFDASKIQVKTVPQGAATTVWAATEALLAHREALYLEDCRVAELLDTPVYTHGVMRYALDADNAARLWREAEKLADIALPLKPD